MKPQGQDPQTLQCMSCNAPMTRRDLACGLPQLCEQCCLQPASMHDRRRFEDHAHIPGA